MPRQLHMVIAHAPINQSLINSWHSDAMPDRSPNLDSLIRAAEASAAQHPDKLGALVAALKAISSSDVDPYLLSGVLIETITVTVIERVPPEKHGEVSVDIVRLLRDRLHAYGMI